MEVRGKFHIIFTLTSKGSAPNSHTIEGYVQRSQSGHYREKKLVCLYQETNQNLLAVHLSNSVRGDTNAVTMKRLILTRQDKKMNDTSKYHMQFWII